MLQNRPDRSRLKTPVGRVRRGAPPSVALALMALAVVTALPLLAAVRAGAEPPPAKVAAAVPSPEAAEFFEAKVRPILVERCQKCHGARKQSAGLRLDSREAALKGGDQGPAIVPGNLEESLVVYAVSYKNDDLQMPPKDKLSDAEIGRLKQWIAQGAAWPASQKTASEADAAPPHWAFQPLKSVALPAVKQRDWAATPIDAFILARLEAAKLQPSPPADKRTLLRRATIDLWGVPPTIQEIEAFLADDAPGAFARVVDRLLASPRYGERWGRHWLDIARYADTKGYVFTQEPRYPYSFTYRDYVVNAFNSDLPYDRFIIEQIAADQIVKPDDKDTRPLAAMGFLTVGGRFLFDQNEIIDDRIDVVTRGLLGLTVSCARCHDHKFDPIPTEDYYALYGVFASSDEPAKLPEIHWPNAHEAPGAAAFQKKMSAAVAKRDKYLAERRADVQDDFAARFSHYLKAAHDLGFNARNGRLTERALADKLDARRLRGAMGLWKRRLASAPADSNAALAPWHAFAALPAAEFATRAADARSQLLARKGPSPTPVNPLVASIVLGEASPKTMDELVARYVKLFQRLETRWKDPKAHQKGQSDQPFIDPEWESLRQAVFGPGKILDAASFSTRMVLNQTQSNHLGSLNGAIDRLNANDPAAPSRAMVMVDRPQPVQPHVFLRGNPGRPGKATTRHFPQVLAGPNPPAFSKGSGRLDLARAIADPHNPLTARVLVNRVWHWHFGAGLVTTPSDFGTRSDPPSHPELLDHLAAEFLAHGWSIKALHRAIMLSNTYQQASAPRPDAAARDAENRLVWRFGPRRIDFEAMRDSILAVSGALSDHVGGRPVELTRAPFSNRRTLYGLVDRSNLDGLYRTFDFAGPDATSPRRYVTTVPQQALFLMNSPFLHEQARRLAANAADDVPSAGPDRVRALYRGILGREPGSEEVALALGFVAASPGTGGPPNWAPPAHGGKKGEAPMSRWEQLAQVLLLTNEFMFLD